MAIEFNGNEIETTATGYLANQDDWSEDLCRHLASADGIELTDAHWDLINYLRDEYFNNAQSTPNTRTIVKAMSDKWGREIEFERTLRPVPARSLQAGRPHRRSPRKPPQGRLLSVARTRCLPGADAEHVSDMTPRDPSCRALRACQSAGAAHTITLAVAISRPLIRCT